MENVHNFTDEEMTEIRKAWKMSEQERMRLLLQIQNYEKREVPIQEQISIPQVVT